MAAFHQELVLRRRASAREALLRQQKQQLQQQQHKGQDTPLSGDCVPVISTDALVEPTYRDTRTVIYIWGRRLVREEAEGGPLQDLGAPSGSSPSSSAPGAPYGGPPAAFSRGTSGEPFVGSSGDLSGSFPHSYLSSSSSSSSSTSLCQPVVLRCLYDTRVTEVAAGETHALFLSDKGIVHAYGTGVYGQLGLGPVLLTAKQPQKIHGLGGPVVQVAAGEYHSVALTEDGSVYSWGAGDSVGDGSGSCAYSPKELLLLESLQASHSPDRGQVLAWGDGTYGELAGNPFDIASSAFTPLTLKDAGGQLLPPIISVAAGKRHALLLTQDLRLWAFGDNLAGQCGLPGHQGKLVTPKLIKVGEMRARVARVACGHRHSGCITPNHQLYLWGHSSDHKLIFTAATEALVAGETQAGVALKSGLKNACCRPRLIYSLLHEKVTCLCLGSSFTIVVTGDGEKEKQKSFLDSNQTTPVSFSCCLNSPHIVTAADLKINTNTANEEPADTQAAMSGDLEEPFQEEAQKMPEEGPHRFSQANPEAQEAHGHSESQELPETQRPLGGPPKLQGPTDPQRTPRESSQAPLKGSLQGPQGPRLTSGCVPVAAPSPSLPIWAEHVNDGGA
ncbi:regulator of chromosome condensation domain-containing protein, putative [Eimeria tenella]|uniref:Regulator of chromosome condensation domain-containing protein, putative n=1 Tax=Eimeria tenella TaxID=5802 RepID=U6KJ17_EIMTE|nr:regulator of chromosome condensation domain-containing protein, putative [Eimeria tenella]CDJ37904.1 regulator of chromosome condensation domain-containing protein, putative [Eimeria tenella]|eukprot:XP_013228742.1 regulator of chromosome condensation domain-containing protein, putative [Eimeria tenella]